MTFYPNECLGHAELRAEAIRSAVEMPVRFGFRQVAQLHLIARRGCFDGSRPLDEACAFSRCGTLSCENIGGVTRIESHGERPSKLTRAQSVKALC